jgi:hypothetical protein
LKNEQKCLSLCQFFNYVHFEPKCLSQSVGAGAASCYGSNSTNMIRFLAALALQHCYQCLAPLAPKCEDPHSKLWQHCHNIAYFCITKITPVIEKFQFLNCTLQFIVSSISWLHQTNQLGPCESASSDWPVKISTKG